MIRTLKLAALALSIMIGGASLVTTSSYAEHQPIHEPTYPLELVDQSLHVGKSVPAHVRLVKLSTAKTGTKNEPVLNATFDQPKLVMLMSGMAPMPGRAEKIAPDADDGIYQFAADLVASGNWALDLTAHAPNKDEPVHDTLEFHVEK